ncbi:MAG: 23S rRNA (adenine(2503)-C(2))-methyltransferase RlmN [Alphaproteobacteria bacterium]|nr:23S rRNA (adenine(2503)-C(2))-methyltransferase RlmN [Alphaproteobacteria bacterium]
MQPIEAYNLSLPSKLDTVEEKKQLIGLSRQELIQELSLIGLPVFRAKQLWHWIYYRGITDFDHMTTFSKSLRTLLNTHFLISRPQISLSQASTDTTRKWLLQFSDHNEIETVHIPTESRGTLCVSSQVGCTLNCQFCHTGTQKLVRNLTSAEIVNQIMVARDELNEWPPATGDRAISNIVMMGMGEPLYNYENVAKALKIVMDPEGIAISKRKITLSTAGVVPMIRQCGQELGVNLAISLHAVRDDLRNQLVPLNKKYPIAELLKACQDYPSLSNARRITFEYIMLKGINDTPSDAKELVRLLKNIHAKINLIPFNPWPGSGFERSTDKSIQEFSDIVFKAGYAAPVRMPRGEDIMAACGQLKSMSERQKKFGNHRHV